MISARGVHLRHLQHDLTTPSCRSSHVDRGCYNSVYATPLLPIAEVSKAVEYDVGCSVINGGIDQLDVVLS